MATTSSSTGPDTLINLKVNHDGYTKKLKLPLRDLGASTLETKLRSLLSITPNDDILIERYSDSAASYVVLDKANVSVFKQLYRAAKAKQKLKLRITRVAPEQEEEEIKVVPKPVTVEDVPEVEPKAAPAPSSPAAPAPVAPGAPRLDGMLAQLHQSRVEMDSAFEGLASALRTRHSVQNDPVWGGNVFERQLPMHLKRGTSAETISRSSLQAARPGFAVCCNSCDENIPNAHYHCSTCDDGDFDLCQSCVDNGVTCYSDSHWLIKRFVQDGAIINSTTERIAPKPKAKRPEPVSFAAEPLPVPRQVVASPIMQLLNVRTCNNCVGEFPETEFVHCTTCYDFDLCISCFDKNDHGHHPKHGFVPAIKGMTLTSKTSARLEPGRNHKHNAVCDGCDKYIYGVRHKCLDCPDWDYCSTCIVNSGFIHPGHRFAPIYEAIKEVKCRSFVSRAHYGICCDGPLCNRDGGDTFIVGDRYKCAVCDNVDFCANCEASPANTHNKTHPLIKFKTPVRHVSVTTTGEHGDGKRMPVMGDRSPVAPEPEVPATREVLSTNVQTVVDVKPTEEIKTEEPVVKQEPVEETSVPAVPFTDADLNAIFEYDTVADGTVIPSNKVFEQTWVLRNAGPGYWPAGCCVKLTGGDYMGHVDSNHPAHFQDLVSASESTVCYDSVAPGQSYPFTVILRAPTRPGKYISYWRMETSEGVKFGDRLWCEIDVPKPKVEEPKVEEPQVEEPKIEEPKIEEPKVEEEPKTADVSSEKTSESQMIFPKLEKESPDASIHEESPSETTEVKEAEETDDFEDCDLEEWDDAASEDGFLTDEEYDILDASDEEYLEEEQKKVAKK